MAPNYALVDSLEDHGMERGQWACVSRLLTTRGSMAHGDRLDTSGVSGKSDLILPWSPGQCTH